MRIESLQQARHLTHQQTTRAFSFDVFDTFLLRRCTAPDGVYELASRYAPVGETRRDITESFVQHRIHAEAKARKQAKERTGASEVTIADIYRVFPYRLFGTNNSALSEFVRAEFRAELDLCFANPEMLRLFNDLRSSGVRAGFISDTYWTREQLTELLTTCAPGLTWDFLYPSCEYGTSKSNALLQRYLEEQALDPSTAIHIGDNPQADIAGAKRHGMRAMYYPQASAHFAGVLQRETTAFNLLCTKPGSSRLDNGLRTLRRIFAGRSPEKAPLFTLGLTVIGPVMSAFDRFVADRVSRMEREGKKVAVAFLARDGFLSLETWRKTRTEPAHYLEINRRISLIGSADTIEPLVDLFRKVHTIDLELATDILKVDFPELRAFFGRFPGGLAPGDELADALPDLIDASMISELSAGVRHEMFAHIRNAIPDFDTCTDLFLVDLGYSGTVQKGLRRIFECEGIQTRLHGLYLLTVDEAFYDLPEGDTAEGFISDLVVPPHVSRMFMRNVAMLEQICCASTGSVSAYRDGEIVRETDPRSAGQISMTELIQKGSLHFSAQMSELSSTCGLDPFADTDQAAGWAAAVLGRLLVLPTDHELALLSELKHDINLGTQMMVPMSDPQEVSDKEMAYGMIKACSAKAPPMWMAGSMAGISPVHGFLYMLYGAGHLPGDVFGDMKSGTLDITLLSAAGGRILKLPCFRTSFGEIRVRIPISREQGIQAIGIPVGRIAPQGTVRALVQVGPTLKDATDTREIARLPRESFQAIGIDLAGFHYRVSEDKGHNLVILPPPPSEAISLVTLAVKPFDDNRALALDDEHE